MDKAIRFLQGYLPELAAQIEQMQRRELPTDWDRNLPVFPATRRAWRGETLRQGAERARSEIPVPRGSADVGTSNKPG